MKQFTNFLRNGFYTLDIAVVCVAAFFAAHYWWVVSPWVYWTLVVYPILMRLNISVMLYRRRWAVMSILLSSMPGLLMCNSGWLEYASEKMVRLMLLLQTTCTGGKVDYGMIDNIGNEYGSCLHLVFIFWLWLLPALIVLVRFMAMKVKRIFMNREEKEVSLRDILGGDRITKRSFVPDWSLSYLWDDTRGRTFVLFLVLSVVAALMGDEMAYLPSLLATVGLPLLAYIGVNRLVSRNVKIKECTMILAGGILFWHAQYYVEFVRFGMLLVSAVPACICAVMVGRDTKKYMLPVISSLFIAFVLPSLGIGYNQYAVMDAARVARFRTYVPTNGVLYVKSEAGYGLRDRYGIVVPCGYAKIRPCRDNYRYVSLENDSQKRLYNLWLNKDTQRRITINDNWQRKAESLIQNAIDRHGFCFGQVVVMDANTGKLKVMASVGNSKTHAGESYKNPWEFAFYTGLIRPFAHLAALQTGRVNLSDSVDTGNGVLMERGQVYRDHNWQKGGYGKITYEEGLRYHSNISTYQLMKTAFGNSADSLFVSLKDYGADQPIRISDEHFTSLVNIKPEVSGRYKDNIFVLANGYGLPMTALQVVGMYSLLHKGEQMRMDLFQSDDEQPASRWASGKGLDAIRQVLSADKLYPQLFAELPDSVKLLCYTGTDRQTELVKSPDDATVKSNCGTMDMNEQAHVVYVMLERSGAPGFGSQLQIIVPELIEHIIRDARYLKKSLSLDDRKKMVVGR